MSSYLIKVLLEIYFGLRKDNALSTDKGWSCTSDESFTNIHTVVYCHLYLNVRTFIATGIMQYYVKYMRPALTCICGHLRSLCCTEECHLNNISQCTFRETEIWELLITYEYMCLWIIQQKTIKVMYAETFYSCTIPWVFLTRYMCCVRLVPFPRDVNHGWQLISGSQKPRHVRDAHISSQLQFHAVIVSSFVINRRHSISLSLWGLETAAQLFDTNPISVSLITHNRLRSCLFTRLRCSRQYHYLG